MGEREGVRPEEEQQAAEQFHRVRASEVYAIPGDPVENLKAAIPVFTEGLVQAGIEALRQKGLKNFILELETKGKNPQTLRASFENPQGDGNLRISLSGDWTKETEIPRGTPFLAPFSGKFQRKKNKADEEPIAKDKQEVKPGDAIGWAIVLKNGWFVRVPEDFPGGIITKFVIEAEEDVEEGKSIICYIEKQ